MINPALEYISRRSEILQLEIPCSFMAQGMDYYDKRVVVVHPVESRPHSVHVKVWNVSRASAADLLPPVEIQDFPRVSLSKPWHFFPMGLKPLGYLAEFPTVNSNRVDRPIPQSVYESICKSMFFSHSHREHREEFLWSAFIETCSKMKKLMGFVNGQDQSVRSFLETYNPKDSQRWSAWRTHMIDFKGEVAPELYYWATSVASSSSCASDAEPASAAFRPG